MPELSSSELVIDLGGRTSVYLGRPSYLPEPPPSETVIFVPAMTMGMPQVFGPDPEITDIPPPPPPGTWPDYTEFFEINEGAMVNQGSSLTINTGGLHQNLSADTITVNTSAVVEVVNCHARSSWQIDNAGDGSSFHDCIGGPNTGLTSAKVVQVFGETRDYHFFNWRVQNSSNDYVEIKAGSGAPATAKSFGLVWEDAVFLGANALGQAHRDGFTWVAAEDSVMRRVNFHDWPTQWSTTCYFQAYQTPTVDNCGFMDSLIQGAQFCHRIHCDIPASKHLNPYVIGNTFNGWALNYAQVPAARKTDPTYQFTDNINLAGQALSKAGINGC